MDTYSLQSTALPPLKRAPDASRTSRGVLSGNDLTVTTPFRLSTHDHSSEQRLWKNQASRGLKGKANDVSRVTEFSKATNVGGNGNGQGFVIDSQGFVPDGQGFYIGGRGSVEIKASSLNNYQLNYCNHQKLLSNNHQLHDAHGETIDKKKSPYNNNNHNYKDRQLNNSVNGSFGPILQNQRDMNKNRISHVTNQAQLAGPLVENHLPVKTPSKLSGLPHAAHVLGFGRSTDRSHNTSEKLPSHARDVQSHRHARPTRRRKVSMIFADMQSLPQVHENCHKINADSNAKKHHPFKIVPSVTTKPLEPSKLPHNNDRNHLSQNFSDKPKQLKYFVKNFNPKETRSLQSVSSFNSHDVPSITQSHTHKPGVPKWFLASVAHSENMDVAKSQEEDTGNKQHDVQDPDLENVTDAQEFYESYQNKLENIGEHDENNDDSENQKVPVWRTLPMQGELQKYLHYLQSGKGLDQQFSKYIGPVIPGKYRSGGPISRPMGHAKAIASVARPHLGNARMESKEGSAQSGTRQIQEMNRMQTRMTTMLND